MDFPGKSDYWFRNHRMNLRTCSFRFLFFTFIMVVVDMSPLLLHRVNQRSSKGYIAYLSLWIILILVQGLPFASFLYIFPWENNHSFLWRESTKSPWNWRLYITVNHFCAGIQLASSPCCWECCLPFQWRDSSSNGIGDYISQWIIVSFLYVCRDSSCVLSSLLFYDVTTK